jgi:transcriptional regulator with PAS, ATPase and Fis domain
VADTTMTDVLADRRGGGAALRRRTVLYVALRANAPGEPPSRHLIDDVDEVTFGRGPRAARRADRRLDLRIPDPLMSADHGRLHRSLGGWALEDPRSRNGAIVAGRATRSAPVRLGEVFELGHTLFLLDAVTMADGDLDVTASDLRPPTPALATLYPPLVQQIDILGRIAGSDVPVLLAGETGTGKEVLAQALHHLSGRRGPFVAVNCGGLTPSLIEAELFGHRRGAFTSAVHDRLGYLRSADHGTLFLDEVGELPPPAQTTLLRALQERAVVPVGDTTAIPVDLRVCAATHRDLPAMVAAGSFREDLYARLLGVTITLPPLRERRCDLGLLIDALLRRLGASATLTPSAAYAMLRYDWPRNVRELERALATAVVLAGADRIQLEHLPAAIADQVEPAPAPAPRAEPDDDDPELRGRLVAALTAHRGNVSAVAAALGKGREQVYRWARRFGIDPAAFK